MKKEKEQKLPKVFKRKWLSALRSGKYNQGSNRLKNTLGGVTTHCCLGVACEIVNQNMLPDDIHSGFIEFGKVYDTYFSKVPELLIGGDENPIVKKLVEMNDGDNGKPRSFKQIANWIEKHL